MSPEELLDIIQGGKGVISRDEMTLTIENVKAGISMGRNPILYSNAPYILPLVGVGTGIPRALKNTPNMELVNDEDRELFIARIFRNVE